jgi:histidine triad (HIT) family protein
VAEDEFHIAFLDLQPVASGHVLVVPKEEVDYLFDLDENAYSRLWLFARKVASGLEKAIPCRRIGISVIGLEVPHTHIHLVPLQTMQDINFSKTKMSPSSGELEEIRQKIASQLI